MLLIDFILGTRTVRVEPCAVGAVYDCFLDQIIQAKRLWRGEDGALYVVLLEGDYRRFLASAELRGCPVPETVSRYGVGLLWEWLKKRPGIGLGLLLALGWIVFSSMLVWRVDVICLDNDGITRKSDYVDTEEVRKELAAQGVSPGLFLPTFDVRHAETVYLTGHQTLSWMAINRRGSVLSVEVRSAHAVERMQDTAPVETPQGNAVGASLVANADGQIVRLEVYNGVPLVLPEEIVVKGQTLVSGVFEARDGDVRFTRSAGKVFASTLRTFSESVPLESTEACYSGDSEERRTLMVFGRGIPLPGRRKTAGENVTFLQIFRNFFGNTGFSLAQYDIIYDEVFLRLPGGTPLPLALRRELRNGKTTVSRTLSPEEARQAAYARLNLDEETLTDATVLSREDRETLADGVLTVTRDIFCIDNIAESYDFQIDMTSTRSDMP